MVQTFEVNLNNVSTPLKFSLIVNQEKLNPFGDGTHGQELVLGLGVECESYEFELPIGGTKHYLSRHHLFTTHQGRI